ncbi:MAG: hypothetical protein QGH83_16000 [Candidatus Pacebacteria bacterium]|jgi:hypothetical protein|nr:hypothetical protein [Candidatus Paceibacterota bacterium]
MSVWSRFTSWLSGWPESKESKKEIEQEYLFAEEEMIKKNNKNMGKKSKKKKTRKQGNMT